MFPIFPANKLVGASIARPLSKYYTAVADGQWPPLRSLSNISVGTPLPGCPSIGAVTVDTRLRVSLRVFSVVQYA